jgi:hypothetical protein
VLYFASVKDEESCSILAHHFHKYETNIPSVNSAQYTSRRIAHRHRSNTAQVCWRSEDVGHEIGT